MLRTDQTGFIAEQKWKHTHVHIVTWRTNLH